MRNYAADPAGVPLRNSSMRRLIVVLLLALPALAVPEYGPHAIGVRLVLQSDISRTYCGHARPVETVIWYPAVASAAPAMRLRDYEELAAYEEQFENVTPAMLKEAREEMRSYANEMSDERWNAILATPYKAVRDAQWEEGRFPVVLYAPGLNGAAAENAELCEVLASHGYVVIASPSMGATERTLGHEAADAMTQARDIDFLAAYAYSLPHADAGRVALIGYSFGGLSEFVAAIDNPDVAAVVALDGAIRARMNDWMSFPRADIDRVTYPMLLIGGRPQTFEQLHPGKYVDLKHNFYNEAKHADAWLMIMLRMTHRDFSSQHRLILGPWEKNDYSADEITEAYEWMTRYIRRFLDATMKRDAAAAAFISRKPRDNGAPPHIATIEWKKAQRTAP